MFHCLKRLIIRTLVVLLALPTSLLMTMPSVAHGAESDVRLNEILVTGTEKVELYNAGTSSVDISGWKIIDAAGDTFHTVPASTVLGTSATDRFYTAIGSTPILLDSGDLVALITPTSVVIDAVSFGDSATAQLVAPASGKTIGRVADGGSFLYSGLTATMGSSSGLTATATATNDSPAVPGLPTGASVKAGTSNAANVINSASSGSVAVSVPLGTSSLATDTVTARLYDATSFKAGTVAGTTGAGTATVTGINSAGAPALVDGTITLKSFVTSATGVSTMYVAGTNATKDTVAPVLTVTSPASATTVKGSTTTVSGTTEVGATVGLYADADNNGVADSSTAVVTATTTGTSWSATLPLSSNSANNVVAIAADAASNSSAPVDVPTITEDSTAPAAPTTVSVVSDSSGKATISFATSASGDVMSYKIYTDNGTGTVNFTTALTSVGHPGSSFVTAVLANGTHQFVVRSLDGLGNESANTTATSVVVNGPKTEQSVAAGATLNLVSSLGLSFTPSNAATITVTNQGTTVPTGSAPSGITFLGQFYDVSATSNAFPTMVRFYYTQAQLTAAGITESQLQGIYFFDSASSSWKRYDSTGVDTADVTIGGAAFAGFVWANVGHFTPLAFGADATAPNKPANFTATAGDGKVDLSWDAVSDATGYTVRYREATSKDTTAYTTLFVSGSSLTKTTVKSLTNGTLYEFGVAASDAVGNQSQFVVVVARPNASGASTAINPSTATSSSSATVTAAALTSTESSLTAEPTTVSVADTGSLASSSTVAPSTEPTDAPSPSGEVKAEQSQEQAGRTRLFVTLLILLIAAGAGAAGYYGYQWWSERPAPSSSAPSRPEPTPAAKPKKNPTKGGRW